ncbi:MAG: alpha/beta fold hydrolase [Chloroflexota bacterium]
MRAIEPTAAGYVANPDDGVRSYYEVFGPADAGRTMLFIPTWSLVHSRVWKMQVPYFARRGFEVITFDGRGNGRSDRPASGYTVDHYTQDALAVLDELTVSRADIVSLSAGCRPLVHFAAEHPERVRSLVMIAPAVRLGGGPRRSLDAFLNEPPDREGWNKYNAVHWREDYRDFVEWFSGQIFSEPHSTKPFDDFVEWAMETDGETLVATTVESPTPDIADRCALISCPTLIVHGDDDRIIPLENSREIQQAIPGSELFIIEGGGHAPNARDPVKVNLTIHEFLVRQQIRIGHREEAGSAST